MAQTIQCDEGHWYDKSQHPRGCPHCGVGAPGAPVDEDTTLAYQADAPARAARKNLDPSGDPEATVAIWRKASGIDPVVGWLVCHEGANQGRDYRLRSGRNAVGRDLSSDICIAGDDSITRLNHAIVFFDSRRASFHLSPGDGRSGVYVNGDVVLQPTMLKPYDVLEMGATKLIFVPLCGASFRWDTEKEGGTSKPERPDGNEKTTG